MSTEKNTDIHIAAWQGNTKAVRHILSNDASMARAVDSTLYGGKHDRCKTAKAAAIALSTFLAQAATLHYTMLPMLAMNESSSRF